MKLYLYLQFCMVVKLDLSNRGKTKEWGCSSRIFGPKREEVMGGWRKLRKSELHKLYSSLNIRVIKPRRMRWVGMQHAWYSWEIHIKFLPESLKADHLEDMAPKIHSFTHHKQIKIQTASMLFTCISVLKI